MLYRARTVPDAAAAFARWRRLFREHHGEDPLLVMAQTFGDRDPRPYGLDGAVEFPPHKLGETLNEIPVELLDPDFSGKVHAYDEAADLSCTEPTPPFPLIKTCVPSWDNDARRQGAGMVLHGASPGRYQAWLGHLVEHARANPFPDSGRGDALVCINAWNEWAEGAYLEPDLRFGSAFLNATGRAVAGLQPDPRDGALLLVGHDAFPAGSQHLLLHLGRQLQQAHGIAVQFLLLGGGRLLKAYQEVAPTLLAADDAALARHAAAAYARGTRAAIVNTAAAAHACPALRDAGIAPTLLAHELPGLLRTRDLVEGARLGVESAQRIVFASAEGRDRFASAVPLPPGRVTVLPQGLYAPARRTTEAEGLRAQLGIAEDAPLALAVGFGDMRKGFDLALKAWSAVQDEGLHLLWVGDLDTNTRALLGADLAVARATGRFHHLPFRPDAADLFTTADVHLLASREDPYPSVVLEAMSAGVPTVAFEGSGGAPGLLREMDAGLAVPMADAAAMARHAVRLARQGPPGGRARLAAAARRRFDFGDYASRLLALAIPSLARISVCIPSRDYARYMPARLGSVLAQTYPVEECIVLDDASSDGSAAVAREAAARAGRQILVIEGKRASGSVFKQWARAARLARGEWLWIAEADDECRPEMLARLAAAARAAPGTILAFCDSRAVDAGGLPLWPDHKAYYAELGQGALAADLTLPAPEFLGRCMAERNAILNASAVLFRRDALLAALDRCGRDLASYRVAGDWRLYAEMMMAGGSVTYVAEPLNTHRRHAASATHRLDPARHVDEIARVHAFIAARLGDPVLPARQRAYRERIAVQLAETGATP
jgi:glycosyltransferase involved in cell wall biosynthesis